jgi:hypothetical protein
MTSDTVVNWNRPEFLLHEAQNNNNTAHDF